MFRNKFSGSSFRSMFVNNSSTGGASQAAVNQLASQIASGISNGNLDADLIKASFQASNMVNMIIVTGGTQGPPGVIDPRIISVSNVTPSIDHISVGLSQDQIYIRDMLNLERGINFPYEPSLTSANFFNEIIGPSGYYGI